MKVKRILSLCLVFILAASLSGCEEGAVSTSQEANGFDHPDVQAFTDDSGMIAGIPMDAKVAVVIETVADVYSKPDVKSERVTQALYNQPVSILEEKGGWYKVKAADGSRGWIKARFIDRRVASIHGSPSTFRVVITSREKAVYSHPRAGVTLKDVVMGTVLYGFNQSGTAYEVYLPGNITGWVRGSGMIILNRNEPIPRTSAEDFITTVLKLKGVSYLSSGISAWGIDGSGLSYICAGINGVELPRDMKGQSGAGTAVKLENLASGDLLFLSRNGEEAFSCTGIYIGEGRFIHADKAKGYVMVTSLEEGNPEYKVTAARRIFDK